MFARRVSRLIPCATRDAHKACKIHATRRWYTDAAIVEEETSKGASELELNLSLD